MADKKKILIAEDEKPMAHALQLKLQREGYSVDIASNGEEVLSMIESGGYSLLILDLVMPKKDGFYVLEELKKAGMKLPVVVASNLGQAEDFERAKLLGAREFFVKSNATLQSIVDSVKKIIQ